MRLAMLSPIAWRTPPRHYGPWESVVSLLTEGLVERGVDVTLFATRDSHTRARLIGVCPRGYEEDKSIIAKVWECLHISELFEQGDQFDLIHNHFDYLPLTYTRMTSTPVLSTIHGFSSPGILPVYKKYNNKVYYVSISDADRSPDLTYIATVHHGIDLKLFTLRPDPGDYLLFFGRIHHDKGTREAIDIARRTDKKLVIAGIIQDEKYYEREVLPHLDGRKIIYVGSAGPEKRNKLLGGAYALLHPINFNEPFGLSVIEAMACGTPVVAFNRGSMPEVIADGKTGFLVSSVEEAVQRLADIDGLSRRACRRWVEERFSVNRMVADYLRVYERILAKRPPDKKPEWGYIRILEDAPDMRVRKVVLYSQQHATFTPAARNAVQLLVVKGRGAISLKGEDYLLSGGETMEIHSGTSFKILNLGTDDLVAIEVLTPTLAGTGQQVKSEVHSERLEFSRNQAVRT
ncbi:MAG: glycosyltransferase [Deltaproteobacteria bacterium]|nr:glycosyltransferase [Deltaproteobacteria bacterium]MBW2072686.1 glycosyltransferase [Deltaproteobacteria bacterium]